MEIEFGYKIIPVYAKDSNFASHCSQTFIGQILFSDTGRKVSFYDLEVKLNFHTKTYLN